MQKFLSTVGTEIQFEDDLAQLKGEHVLQAHREAWVVVAAWPYLAIDRRLLRSRVRELKRFPVYSCGQLWQNLQGMALATRLLNSFGGAGTNAGFGKNSRAFVEGRANAKANTLINWNPPLVTGSTPWIASGTHFTFVDDKILYQYRIGELVTVESRSRPASSEHDFSTLSDLRDRYYTEYFSPPRDEPKDLTALSTLLDETFTFNGLSLAAAEAYHLRLSPSLISADYAPPALTKFERLTHDAGNLPKIQVSFSLLHYEKAIVEFNALKACHGTNRADDALVHGVFCTVAIAACIEAIGNYLVHAQTGSHPVRSDNRIPLKKVNDAAASMASDAGVSYAPLVAGEQDYDLLDYVRQLRNQFMHAKEIENDIDPIVRASTLTSSINEASCRSYLAALKSAMDKVFNQLPNTEAPIVTKVNHTWMGDLEVP